MECTVCGVVCPTSICATCVAAATAKLASFTVIAESVEPWTARVVTIRLLDVGEDDPSYRAQGVDAIMATALFAIDFLQSVGLLTAEQAAILSAPVGSPIADTTADTDTEDPPSLPNVSAVDSTPSQSQQPQPPLPATPSLRAPGPKEVQ